MPPAIRAARVAKRYRLGEQVRLDGSFREMLANAAGRFGRRLRRRAAADASAEDASFWALREVSFDLQPGEVTAVIGRNGAGKSTLLKILSRITEPTAGRIELRGRVASLLEVGTGFHPELTGRENVFLNGAILGMRRREIHRKFDAIVDFAELARFIDTPVKRYSSGMYLRLAFAVAAHLDGEILLIDEVLAVGDAAFQQKCLGKMQDVSRGGRSVLFVTHNMAAASSLCERGILLEGGRVRLDGPVQEAIKTYMSDAVAAGTRGWDVAAERRDHGHGELLRLTRIETRPAQGSAFHVGEGLAIRVRFRSETTRSEVCVGVGVDDILGHRLATFDSHEVGFSLDVDAGRDYIVDLTVPRPSLNPGRYFLSVSLFSGRSFFDLLFHVGAIDVAPIDAATGDYYEPHPGAGPLRLPYRWAQAEAVPLDAAPAASVR